MTTDNPPETQSCPECNGTGRVEQTVVGAVDGGDAVMLVVCPECGGSGELVQRPDDTQPE